MKREVSSQEGFDFAEKNNLIFFEVSAFENFNITEAMMIMAEQILETHQIERIKR